MRGESNSLIYEEEKKDENYHKKDRKRMGIQIEVSISEEYEIDLDNRQVVNNSNLVMVPRLMPQIDVGEPK
jgi:hypothetical protein